MHLSYTFLHINIHTYRRYDEDEAGRGHEGVMRSNVRRASFVRIIGVICGKRQMATLRSDKYKKQQLG